MSKLGFRYVRPSTIREVVEALQTPKARIIAGGTDLMIELKEQEEQDCLLVDVTAIFRLAPFYQTQFLFTNTNLWRKYCLRHPHILANSLHMLGKNLHFRHISTPLCKSIQRASENTTERSPGQKLIRLWQTEK